MNKIPFHIISGFLGSGKTTFLKKIIEEHAGTYRLGIIQNEFAPANVDGALLKQSGEVFDLLEINNGSVFCVCLLADFARSLEKFIDTCHPDILIMEASGLSDTTSVSEVLTSGGLAQKIVLASNWCIVDALNFGKTGSMGQRVSHQLRMADVVVINKTDLVPGGTDVLKGIIKKENPFAGIVETSYCQAEFLPGGLPESKFYFAAEKPLTRPDINSIVIKSSKKMSREALLDFLNQWAPRAYRIKGFINLKNREVLAVQCVFGQVDLKPVPDALFPTELIAITGDFTLSQWNKSFREYSL
jgi:G3E family GTPase